MVKEIRTVISWNAAMETDKEGAEKKSGVSVS